MRRLVYLTSAALVAAAAVLVPLPVLVLSPGPTEDVAEVLQVEGDVEPVNGRLLLTTVVVEPASFYRGLAAVVEDEQTVVPRRQVVPPGVDPGEYSERQQDVFRESVRVAAAVGLRLAGMEVEVTGRGALVEAILPGSPAEGRLQEGDVIVAVDGRPVSLASELAARASAADPGDALRLEVRRDGRRSHVTVAVRELPTTGRPGLGVLVSTVDQRIDLPIRVEPEPGLGIGGSSAGLMFALGVYDLVDPVDLAAGRVIAGTGTIDPTGRVGPVGGVAQKVEAAADEGARLFLVPAAEAGEAGDAAPPEMEVIPVRTAEEALDALRRGP